MNSITFNYRERGSDIVREVELPIISPEFYENGKKALKIYSTLLDIKDKYGNKNRFAAYKLLKEAGYVVTQKFFSDLDVSIDPRKKYKPGELEELEKKIKIKEDVEMLMMMADTFANSMYLEMYEYLVENLFLFNMKDLGVDWTNPCIPYLDIAQTYLIGWREVFLGNYQPSSQNTQNENTKEELSLVETKKKSHSKKEK